MNQHDKKPGYGNGGKQTAFSTVPTAPTAAKQQDEKQPIKN